MSTAPFSDTQKRQAKALKKLAEDELVARPSHRLCLELVRATPRQPDESRELFAARLFEANRAALSESADQGQP